MQERNELIRTEAVLHKASRAYSVPVIDENSSFGFQLWFYVVFLLLFVLLLARTNYKETVTARGILQPQQGSQKIASPVTAMLRRIYVEPGDTVYKGQVLALLSTTLFDYSGKPQQEVEIQQFKSSRELLRQEMYVQEKLYARSIAKNKAAVISLKEGKRSMAREVEILLAQLRLSNTNLKSLEYLRDTSSVSQSYFDQQYVANLNLRLRQEELNRHMIEISHQLSDSEGMEESINFEFEKNSLQMQREAEEIDYHIRQLAKQQLMTVLAEDDGIVAAVAVSQGKTVTAGEAMFSIHPVDDQLLAVLYVPAKVQGRLFPSQQLLLSYDGFDYRLFGRYTATISELSQASLDPREQLLPVPGISEPVFKIVATLDQDYVEGSEVYRLQSGMLLTADFLISELSLLEFIFKPLLGLRGKVW